MPLNDPEPSSDVRLDEFTRLEVEDIMRRAVAALGGSFDEEKFDRYWREAVARKRRRAVS